MKGFSMQESSFTDGLPGDFNRFIRRRVAEGQK